jgi:arylsulfatase A-like enzyme
MLISLISLLLLGIILPLLLNPATEKLTADPENATVRANFPNILLITADSLDAADMSLYGSELESTPFLKQLSGSSLLAENAFSNAQGTIGALTSLLSGKYPADERVIYSTDILSGRNSYQHLPGILNAYGYQTVQLSYSYYADAYTINMLGGFDEANGRKVTASGGFLELVDKLFPSDFHVFLREVTDRAGDRLAHIFFIRDMADPYKQVTEGIIKISDQKKMERVLALLADADRPVFIHLHWMGTHGPKFYPTLKVFSAIKDNSTQKNYDPDVYADAILEFDQAIKALYTRLEQEGKLDHTLLVISSDHSQKWTNSRLPLLMHFPGGEHQQVITHNVQYLDIAPTLLHYLGIKTPQWMAGESLLDGVAVNRPIFTAEIPKSTKDKLTGKITYPAAKAPFYQFGRMAVVLCDRWYELDLTTLDLSAGKVKDYVGDCTAESSTPQQALELIAAHLEKYGFDISSLKNVTLPR